MLGSRKLLIFVLCLALVGSFFALSLFAEDRVRQEDDLTQVRSVSNPSYYLTPSGVDVFRTWLNDEGHTGYSTKYQFLFQVYLYNVVTGDSGVIDYCYSQGSSVYVYGVFTDYQVTEVEYPFVLGFDSDTAFNFFVDTVGVSLSDISFSDSNTNIINASLDIGDSIFAIGGAIVSFVTSSWITILALVAVLLVLGFGVIRKLVKGV